MKSILMSFSPYWYYLIGEGIKITEIRKKIPKNKYWNGTIECYMTKDEKSFGRIPKEFQEKYRKHFGKVGMRFECEEIMHFNSEFWDDETYEKIQQVIEPEDFIEYGEYDYYTFAENGENNWLCESACITWAELREYIGQGDKEFYGLHISDLQIYDTPRELSEFLMDCKNCSKKFVGDKDCWQGCVNGCRRLTRPPQSWQYVEE